MGEESPRIPFRALPDETPCFYFFGLRAHGTLMTTPLHSACLCIVGTSSLVQIITRKELNKRMFSSAGTRKLYMMQLGDNT